MSHTRKVALFLSLVAVVAAGSWQQSSASVSVIHASDVELAAYSLVAAPCGRACETQCTAHDGCDDWFTIGCNCYWLCMDGNDGSQICIGAIGVKICDL